MRVTLTTGTLVLLLVGLLLTDQLQPARAIKKKKLIKKLKDMLPLLLAIKPKKKFIIFPIPIP